MIVRPGMSNLRLKTLVEDVHGTMTEGKHGSLFIPVARTKANIGLVPNTNHNLTEASFGI